MTDQTSALVVEKSVNDEEGNVAPTQQLPAEDEDEDEHWLADEFMRIEEELARDLLALKVGDAKVKYARMLQD